MSQSSIQGMVVVVFVDESGGFDESGGVDESRGVDVMIVVVVDTYGR